MCPAPEVNEGIAVELTTCDTKCASVIVLTNLALSNHRSRQDSHCCALPHGRKVYHCMRARGAPVPLGTVCVHRI